MIFERDRTSIRAWNVKKNRSKDDRRERKGRGGDGFHCRAFIYERRFFFPDVVYSIPRDTDIIPHPRQGIPYLDGWHGFRAFTTSQFCSMGSPVMRIYVELPFSPRNSPFLSLSLPLSLSRSPANRARNDSLRIFEISLFQNPSSLNISIPSYPSIITSSVSTKNIRIIAWKKRKEIVLRPFILSLWERKIKIKMEEKRRKRTTNRSFLSRNQFQFLPRSIIFLSFFFSPR